MKTDSVLPARLYNLDVIRGLASLSVVIWHWQHFFFIEPGELSASFKREQQPLYAILFPFYEHGMMAVALFFVLSGFVFFWMYERKIAEGSCTLRTFFVSRFARLYPLHFVTLNIVAVLQYAHHAQTGRFFVYPFNDFYHYILNLFFASNWRLQRGSSFNSPIWSVSIEVLLYGIFFLICYTRQASWWKLLVIVGGTFWVSHIRDAAQASIPRELLAAEGFFIGGLTYYVVQWYLPRRKAWMDWTIIAFTVTAWLSISTFPVADKVFFSGDRLAAHLIFALTIVASILHELRYGAIGKRIVWIGDTTYSTYLLHFPLQLLFVNSTVYLGQDPHFYFSPVSLGVFFLILMPASVASYTWLERPAQSWIRKRALLQPRTMSDHAAALELRMDRSLA